MKAPEPHPLDFDWRFNAATARRLADLMKGYGSALCVGAPSVACLLENDGVEVSLVERQPLQSVRNLISADPSTEAALTSSFSIAFADPPWYPKIYERWLAWTATHIKNGGELLASLWLPDTRPQAEVERHAALEWIASWADVEVEPFALTYTAPLFEMAAMLAEGAKPNHQHWRTGSLLRIRPYLTPSLPASVVGLDNWVRFVFDDYQLALRLREGENSAPRILPVPGAKEWVWPSVSRRAAGRERIDLWSSRNEVALVEGGYEVLRHLRLIMETDGMVLRDPRSEILHTLTRWQIPIGPYRRTLEWTHRA
jgi:hypothetical protein